MVRSRDRGRGRAHRQGELVTMTRVPTLDPVRIFHVTLNDGRHIQFFANVETNLVCVDVVDADEQGGCEVYRREV